MNDQCVLQIKILKKFEYFDINIIIKHYYMHRIIEFDSKKKYAEIQKTLLKWLTVNEYLVNK